MVGVMAIMATRSNGLRAACHGSQDCCGQCPWPCSRPLSTHTFTRVQDSHRQVCSVPFRVTAPFSWVLGCTSFCCALQESVFQVLWKFCNQISLAFKVKFPRGSQSLCWIPRLGNLLWALELLQHWGHVLVRQDVGRGHVWWENSCLSSAHANEYLPELPLPVYLSTEWATTAPSSAGDLAGLCLTQSLIRSLAFFPGSWSAQDSVCVLQGWSFCFTQSCGIPAVKPHWSSKLDSLGTPHPVAWEAWCGRQNFHSSGRTSVV